VRGRLDVAVALAYRQTTILFKNPSLFLPPMLFPLLNFCAFAGGLSRLRHVPGFDFHGGYTAFQFVFVLLQSAAFGGVFAVVLTAVALAVRMQVGGDGIDLFGLYGLAVIVNQVGLLWACGIAMRFRTVQAGPLMQTPVFMALFLAPVYVPLNLLRGWIHDVARFNPLTFLLEAGRGFLEGSPTDVGLAFGVGLALVVCFAVWAFRGLRRAEAVGA
jgi:ABC-type multidrug transport system permease subunit